ncbi:hypothetical protein K0U07_02255 [bacterium]|nr:hypothetical protein [bacterium]
MSATTATDLNPGGITPSVPQTFFQHVTERAWSIIKPQTTTGRVILAVIVIATIIFTASKIVKHRGASREEDPLVTRHKRTIETNPGRFFSIENTQRAVFKAEPVDGGGGGERAPVAEDDIDSHVPEFDRKLIDQRATDLQTIIVTEFGRDADDSIYKTLFTLFLNIGASREAATDEDAWKDLLKDNKGNTTTYTMVIKPFLDNVGATQDVEAKFDCQYWNARIAEHCDQLSDMGCLALGELMYYLHEAHILFLIDEQLQSDLATTMSEHETRQVKENEMQRTAAIANCNPDRGYEV